MQQTRLYDRHMAMGGRMVPFAGWELPVQYPTGPLAEHQAVRSAAGLFDIDHMGQFEVEGPDAEAYLQHVQVWDVARMDTWDAHYSMLTYADGTIVDDIFLYRLPTSWMVVVNAGNLQKDLTWMLAHTHGFQVRLNDISASTYMMAVQGPKAAPILQRLADVPLDQVPARTCIRASLNGIDTLMGRTGYTGEDGFELYLPAEHAGTLWDHLLETGREDGLLACGLAARDSLRFEACLPLYGHEIDAHTNPFEARQGWVVSLDKPGFVGRDALWKTKLEQPHRLLVGFEMVDKAVPREHYPIAVHGDVVGHVTTGMKSPTLDKFLGMGYVPRAHSRVDTEIEILVRAQPRRARIVPRPFYRSHHV
jgi:aminomethyltransferase